MSGPTELDMDVLHGTLCKLLTETAKGALEDVNKEPDPENPVPKRIMTAAEMSVAVALLKNSNISAKRNVGSALDELESVLKKKPNAKPTAADLTAAMAAMEFNQAH